MFITRQMVNDVLTSRGYSDLDFWWNFPRHCFEMCSPSEAWESGLCRQVYILATQVVNIKA